MVSPAPTRPLRAFTLIEMLVVISIIAVLAALLFPFISGALRSGKQSTSLNNLRQWAVAFQGSVADNSGEMPSDGGPELRLEDEASWYNRMPRKINITPLKDATNDLPAIGKRSVWINPGVPPTTGQMNGIPFTYGFNDYLSTTAEPTMKVTRVNFPARTILMAEKLVDASPVLTPGNIRGYFSTKSTEDDDAVANIIFLDGHADGVKRKVFLNPKSYGATTEEQMRETEILWLPYEGAQP